MEICLVSDIHMEIGGFPGKTKFLQGDVLIIAGDLTCARYFDETHESYHNQHGKAQRNNMASMKRHWFPKFKQIFYIMGNHEHYGYDLCESSKTMAEALSDVHNLKVLDNETFMYDGVLFIGSTLWTNFNNGDGYDMTRAEIRMNDYRTIAKDGRTVRPEIILTEHRKSLEFIEATLAQNKNVPTVMITHHGPSMKCQNVARHGPELLYSYCSDLDYITEMNDQIKVWCSGHTHDNSWFIINKTRFVSNQRGYEGYEKISRNFKPVSFVLD